MKSLSIKDKLFANSKIQNAKTILFYASFDGEVNTYHMIEQARQLGKRVALPRIDAATKEIIPTLWDVADKLESGPYGIHQPCAKPGSALDGGTLDAVIVPGVAFDKDNHRLGRGAGYYDRFLSRIPSNVPTIGLAFDFQCVPKIPELAAHDIPVSCVVHN
jgi:5-formyltetrahydrofolate cyclo-ligase